MNIEKTGAPADRQSLGHVKAYLMTWCLKSGLLTRESPCKVNKLTGNGYGRDYVPTKLPQTQPTPHTNHTHRLIIFSYLLTSRRLWRPPVYKMDTVLWWWSVGLTYEQIAVKLVVWVLKSGTVLYIRRMRISVCWMLPSCVLVFSFTVFKIWTRRVVKHGFQYLFCITHAQLRKEANRIECEVGCVVWSS